MYKVFVYGSLLSGFGNNRLLLNSKKLGDAKTPKLFNMLDLGWFPGVVIEKNNPIEIKGEVYEVDDSTLEKLDRLEGFIKNNPKEGLYDRIEIETEYGKAYIYVYNNRYSHNNKVINGDWRDYVNIKVPKR